MRKLMILTLISFFAISASAQRQPSLKQLQREKERLTNQIANGKALLMETWDLLAQLRETQGLIDGQKEQQGKFTKTKTQNESNWHSREALLNEVVPFAINFPLRFRYNRANVEMAIKLGNEGQYKKVYKIYESLLKNYERYNSELIQLFQEYKNHVPAEKDYMQDFIDEIYDKIWNQTSYGKDILKKNKKSIPYLNDVIDELAIRTKVTPEFLQSLIDKLQPK